MIRRSFLFDPAPPTAPAGGGGNVPPAPAAAAPAAPQPSPQVKITDAGKTAPMPDSMRNLTFKAIDMNELEDGDGGPASSEPVSPTKPSEPTSADVDKKLGSATPTQPAQQQAPSSPSQVTVPPVTPVATQTSPLPVPFVKLPDTPRDYNGFDEEAQKHLKQMSNEAFNWTTKQLNEAKKAAANIYLQHPQGYMLSTEYQKMNEDSYYLKQAYAIQQQNLANILDGKDWQPFKGFDKNGNPVLDAARKPTAMDAEHVRMDLSALQQNYVSNEGKLQQYAQNFRQMNSAADVAVNNTRKELFSWVSDPKVMDAGIKFNGQDTTVKQVHEFAINHLPPQFRNLPVTPLIGDLWVWNTLLQNEIASLKQTNGVQQTKITEAAKVEPSSARGADPAPASPYPNTPAMFSIKGMSEFMG